MTNTIKRWCVGVSKYVQAKLFCTPRLVLTRRSCKLHDDCTIARAKSLLNRSKTTHRRPTRLFGMAWMVSAFGAPLKQKSKSLAFSTWNLTLGKIRPRLYALQPKRRDEHEAPDAEELKRLLHYTTNLSHVCDSYRVIKHNGSIVALQLPRKLPLEICHKIREWHSGWHGTPLASALSIMQYGLRAPGTVLPNGRVIRVSPDHVQSGVFHNGVENWAQGIFLAPSITYASMDSFTSPGASKEAQNWRVVMNARCDPNVATAHAGTDI